MHEGRGLLEVAKEKMRTRHFAYRTEQIYLHWIRRYVNFYDRRHPRGLGHEGVEKFLSHLAVDAKVGASTQNQALQALLFLYRQVLDIDLPWLENVTRASRPERLPVVLTPSEVRSVLAQLEGTRLGWAMPMFAPRCSTRTSLERAQWESKVPWTDLLETLRTAVRSLGAFRSPCYFEIPRLPLYCPALGISPID